jgi:hypothetical protein
LPRARAFGAKRQEVAPAAEQYFCGVLLLDQFAVSSKHRRWLGEILKQTACLIRQCKVAASTLC